MLPNGDRDLWLRLILADLVRLCDLFYGRISTVNTPLKSILVFVLVLSWLVLSGRV